MSSWDLYADRRRPNKNSAGRKRSDRQSLKEQCANLNRPSGQSLQQSFEFSFPSATHSKSKSMIEAAAICSQIPEKTILPQETNGEIESVLPYSAWPVGELSEIRTEDTENIFHLLLPLLSKLSSQNRWITLISPPADIDKKLFAYHGIDVSRVLLIHPKNAVDDTATMNKALKNGTSGIVIMWTDRVAKRFVAQWRKSVKQGNCRGVIVNRDLTEHCFPSVALALKVSSSDQSITITSTQRFGREISYRAKRSFPIVRFDNQVLDTMVSGSYCRLN